MRGLLGVVGGGGKEIGSVGILKLGLEGLEGCSLLMWVVLEMGGMLMLGLLGLLGLKCGVVIHGEVRHGRKGLLGGKIVVGLWNRVLNCWIAI